MSSWRFQFLAEIWTAKFLSFLVTSKRRVSARKAGHFQLHQSWVQEAEEMKHQKVAWSRCHEEANLQYQAELYHIEHPATGNTNLCFVVTWQGRVSYRFCFLKLIKGRCIQQEKRHSSAVIWPRWPTPLVQLFGESEETDIRSLNLKCWGGRQHEIFADLQIITRSFSHTHALVFSSIVSPLWTFAAFSCSAKHRVLSSLPPLLRLWRTSRTATDWNDSR